MAPKTLDKNKLAQLASALDPTISTETPPPPSHDFDPLTELVRTALADRKVVPEGLDVPATSAKLFKAHPDLASFYDEQALAEILGHLIGQSPLLAVASNPALTETLFFHAHLKMLNRGDTWRNMAWHHLFWQTNPMASGSLGLLTNVGNGFHVWGSEPWNTLYLSARFPFPASVSMLRYVFGDTLWEMGFVDNYLDHSVRHNHNAPPDLSGSLLRSLSRNFSLKWWTANDDVDASILLTLKRVKESMRSAKLWQEKAFAMMAWGSVLEDCIRQDPSLDALATMTTLLDAFREEHGLSPYTSMLSRVL